MVGKNFTHTELQANGTDTQENSACERINSRHLIRYLFLFPNKFTKLGLFKKCFATIS